MKPIHGGGFPVLIKGKNAAVAGVEMVGFGSFRTNTYALCECTSKHARVCARACVCAVSQESFSGALLIQVPGLN